MCSVEVVKEMVLCRAVDDSVLPSVVGGTTVLVTSTVVDVLASVVVPTGVVVSPGVLDGGITSLGLPREVVLAPAVHDGCALFCCGRNRGAAYFHSSRCGNFSRSSHSVVLSTELLEGLLTSVEVLSEVELAGSVDVGVLSSVVVGTGMLVTSTVVVGVEADNNLLHCVRISLEVSNKLILTRILDDGVLPSVLSVIGLFLPSALLSSFPQIGPFQLEWCKVGCEQYIWILICFGLLL
jgi:hypothetical protein